ncbi:MAG: T9SS type A sorting domain-containing protein [Bacteroidales bacterium]|nr:T9SS type A sorting domain-containing protein [Bacteroidales bacterium]
MKTKIFFAGVVAFAFSAPAAVAQSAVATAGGEAAGQSWTISYTVGQVAASTAMDEATLITEGVQQSPSVSVQRIDEVDALPDVSVYPNPTAAMVTLRREAAEPATSVSLFDGAGRALASRAWSGETLTLDLAALPSGMYMVRVACGKDRVKNYKIIKE